MNRELLLDYMPECARGQTFGYLLAFAKLTFPDSQDPDFVYYTTRIDACADKIYSSGDYIQVILYGSKKIPFSIVVPYTDELFAFLEENKRKKFDLVLKNPPKPFGRGMYNAKDN